MNNLETAKKLHQLGWSVIPIKPNSKIAMVEWEKYQKRLATDLEIERWFKDPTVNLALVCGSISGVLVVDQDSYKDKYKELSLTSPLTVTTRSGGKHLYFKYAEGVKNSVNHELAIDVRGEGGYVLVPESVIDGKSYKWDQEITPELLAELPGIPVEEINKLKPGSNSNGISQYNYADSIAVPEGARNDMLYRGIISDLNRLKLSEWSSLGWRKAVALNSTYEPPLADHELKQVFDQAVKFVTSSPKKAVLKTDPNWKPTTNSQDLENVKKIFKEGLPIGISSGYIELDVITKGFIPGQTYLFFADTNVGKSIFVLNMLVRMAKNGIKSVYFDLENPIYMTIERLAIVANDYLTKEIWDQAVKAKAVDGYIDGLTNLPIYIWDLTKLDARFGSISYEAVEQCILEAIKEGVKVFAIDHIHYFEPGVQNFNKIAEIARQFNDISAKYGVVVIFVAHTKKGSTYEKDGEIKVRRPTLDSVNGSSLISRHTKNVIALSRNSQATDSMTKKDTTIYVDKTKSGPTGKFNLVFNPENLHFTEDADLVKLQPSEAQVEQVKIDEQTQMIEEIFKA